MKTAILSNACSIIVAHNHPSGNPSPSPEDIDVTRRLIEAGEIIGIDVLDHLIIGEDEFVSLKKGVHVMPIHSINASSILKKYNGSFIPCEKTTE